MTAAFGQFKQSGGGGGGGVLSTFGPIQPVGGEVCMYVNKGGGGGGGGGAPLSPEGKARKQGLSERKM